MSQQVSQEILDNETEENNTSLNTVDNKTEIQEIIQPVDKIEDVEIKRRPSQNSEENGTPVQTDNDDVSSRVKRNILVGKNWIITFQEQQTEHDTEDQDERNEKSKSKSCKRKRDLLTDLRVWGWHSKRKNVRKTRPDKFYTVEDCLNQILPSNLL